MQQKRVTTAFVLAVIYLVFLTSLALAEEAIPKTTPIPLVIDADYISYHSETGDFSANGNVLATQGKLLMKADKMDGNMTSKDVHALGNVFWQQETDHFTTEEAFYNYETGTGSFPKEGEGFADGYYLHTGSMVKDAKKAVFTGDNWRSKCSAHGTKCYEMRATRVIIYPETKKLTAKNASFWIAGKQIFSVKSYTTTIGKDKKKNSLIPKIGYSDDKGLELEYNLLIDYDANRGRSLDMDINYYSKRGLELGLHGVNQNARDRWALNAGETEDDDDYKLRTLPALGWQMNSQKIPSTKLNYTYGAELGYYEQEAFDASSWRMATNAFLYHDPIPLWSGAYLNLWTGYQKNWYEDSMVLEVMSYGSGINQKLGDKVDLGFSYVHRDITGRSPFNFDDPGAADTFYTNVSYRPHPKWNLSLASEYNLNANRYEDIDYYVTTNLHCFDFTIGYREKRDEWIWSYDLVNF